MCADTECCVDVTCVRPPLLPAQLVLFLSAAFNALEGNDKETWTRRIWLQTEIQLHYSLCSGNTAVFSCNHIRGAETG